MRRSLYTIPSILPSLLILILTSSPTSATPRQIPLGPSSSPPPSPATIPHTFRHATLDDIDDITTVWYDAFRPAPLWDYVRQFANDVDPLYTWTCQRDNFLRMLQDEARGLNATVITVQVPDDGSSSSSSSLEAATATRERVVSVAIWDFNETRPRRGQDSPYPLSPVLPFLPPVGAHDSVSSVSSSSSAPAPPPFNCSARLDTNLTRALPLSRLSEEAQETYLRSALGPQLYLMLLATHPGWDGNGFGGEQLRWGKAQLGRLGGGGGGSLPLTLMASPAGYPLYASKGFEGLKNVTVERLDGKGVFWLEMMKFVPGGGGADEL